MGQKLRPKWSKTCRIRAGDGKLPELSNTLLTTTGCGCPEPRPLLMVSGQYRSIFLAPRSVTFLVDKHFTENPPTGLSRKNAEGVISEEKRSTESSRNCAEKILDGSLPQTCAVFQRRNRAISDPRRCAVSRVYRAFNCRGAPGVRLRVRQAVRCVAKRSRADQRFRRQMR